MAASTRFPNGEAGTDVFDRVASFITYLFRTMGDRGYFGGRGAERHACRQLCAGHYGLLMRIFCMCYLRWTVKEFEEVWNPSNCEIWVLQRVEGKSTYALEGRWRASPYGGSFSDLAFGKNKKGRMFEHVKTPLVSRLVSPGMTDALDSIELAHLRTLPSPKVVEGSRKRRQGKSRQRAMRPRSWNTGRATTRRWSARPVTAAGDDPARLRVPCQVNDDSAEPSRNQDAIGVVGVVLKICWRLNWRGRAILVL